MKKILVLLGLVITAACGGAEDKKQTGPSELSGFEFEIAIEPSTFLPNAASPVKIASDGDPAGNPTGTVQLYTPNDTLTWLSEKDGSGIFAFDVEVTNFYTTQLCAVSVVVDSLEPAAGHDFIDDDSATAFAGDVTGAAIWAYGDLAVGGKESRRWKIQLDNRERFVLRGRVLADESACGQ